MRPRDKHVTCHEQTWHAWEDSEWPMMYSASVRFMHPRDEEEVRFEFRLSGANRACMASLQLWGGDMRHAHLGVQSMWPIRT